MRYRCTSNWNANKFDTTKWHSNFLDVTPRRKQKSTPSKILTREVDVRRWTGAQSQNNTMSRSQKPNNTMSQNLKSNKFANPHPERTQLIRMRSIPIRNSSGCRCTWSSSIIQLFLLPVVVVSCTKKKRVFLPHFIQYPFKDISKWNHTTGVTVKGVGAPTSSTPRLLKIRQNITYIIVVNVTLWCPQRHKSKKHRDPGVKYS